MHAEEIMRVAPSRRFLLPLLLLAAVVVAPLSAQVAPTLPRDTLGGRTLPPDRRPTPRRPRPARSARAVRGFASLTESSRSKETYHG
jgi:hypothetical protein